MPKVSVLMPVYNAAPYLKEAIDSILGQSFTEFELIIINDGSTDSSNEIIKSYQDPRISFTNNESNLGLVETLNLGIDLAQGEYIARMDGDDISLPERLARQVDFMDAHPEVGACGSAFQFFGDSDRIALHPSDYKQCFTLLSVNSSLGHPTSMIRRKVLTDHHIRYENEYHYAADYAFWIRVSQVSCISSLPETLLLYRWHSANMSKTDPSRAMARIKARILWHELVLGSPISNGQRNYLSWNFKDWETFQAGKKLIAEVLESPLIDRHYFGELAVTEWEMKFIDYAGFRGLIKCFVQTDFRKRSRATAMGLIAHYLGKYGITFRR